MKTEEVIGAFFDWEEKQPGVITNCEAFQAGAAYAATLRQQAGRVDEDAVDRAVEAFHDVYDGVSHNERDALRHVLAIAALAQNTQGDGEPVAEVYEYPRDHHEPAPVMLKGIRFTGMPLPVGTKLYLHAERARVPAVDGVRFVAWMIDNREGCYVTEEGLHGWLAQFLREEAAAPSQRAEVK